MHNFGNMRNSNLLVRAKHRCKDTFLFKPKTNTGREHIDKQSPKECKEKLVETWASKILETARQWKVASLSISSTPICFPLFNIIKRDTGLKRVPKKPKGKPYV